MLEITNSNAGNKLESKYCLFCQNAGLCYLNPLDCPIAQDKEIDRHLTNRNGKERHQEWEKTIEDILETVLENQKIIINHIKNMRITLHATVSKS